MASETGLVNTLCVITGLGAVLNLFTFVVKLIPVKTYSNDSKHDNLLICCGTFSNLFHVCTAVTILVLVINADDSGDFYSDVGDHVLKKNPCLVGGFFALFGVVESLFLLAGRSILFTLRTKQMNGKPNRPTSSKNEQDQNDQLANQAQVDSVTKRKVVYCTLQVVQSVVWSVLCFIPLITQSLMPVIPHARLNETQIYFRCVPLTLISEAGTSIAGWQYSCFIIIVLGWCPVIVSTVSITVGCLLSRDVEKIPWTRRVLFAQLALEVAVWIVIISVASVTFFSDGQQLSAVSTHWILGYLASTVLLWHSAVEFAILLKEWCASSGDKHRVETLRHCPDNITVVTGVSSHRCLHQQVRNGKLSSPLNGLNN